MNKQLSNEIKITLEIILKDFTKKTGEKIPALNKIFDTVMFRNGYTLEKGMLYITIWNNKIKTFKYELFPEVKYEINKEKLLKLLTEEIKGGE